MSGTILGVSIKIKIILPAPGMALLLDCPGVDSAVDLGRKSVACDGVRLSSTNGRTCGMQPVVHVVDGFTAFVGEGEGLEKAVVAFQSG